ncbi:MAG: IS66 family transposase [Pseudomonadota bacterium]
MSETSKAARDLPDDADVLKAIVGDLEARVMHQKLEIESLQEKLRLALAKRFGASSEKTPPDQLGLFNEAEVTSTVRDDEDPEEDVTPPAHKRAKGGRRPLPQDLPRVRIEHDIPEADKLCPCGSGQRREKIGEVVTEQADIVPAKVQVLQHVRYKYGPCACCDGVFPASESQTDEDTGTEPAAPLRAVVVAPLPAQPIPKSLASPGTCAFVATAKYVDGLPLYRQEKILARYGFDISRGRLAFWMIRLGAQIVPLLNLMDEKQVSYDILQIDETTLQVLKEDGRVAQTQSHMWVRRGGPPGKHSILFNYAPTRSGKVAWRLTEDFKGYLQSDGYGGYDGVGKREDIVHIGCLAHARRKFDEAVKAQAKIKTGRGGLAKQGLALINRIYRVDHYARKNGLKLQEFRLELTVY